MPKHSSQGVPIARSLSQFLSTERDRISKAKQQIKYVNLMNTRMATQDTQKRKILQSKISEQQQRKEKLRNEKLEAVKEKFKYKLDYVKERYQNYQEEERKRAKSNRVKFDQQQQYMINFWEKHRYSQQLKMSQQILASPMHELAVQKKKKIEHRNCIYSEFEKQKFLGKFRNHRKRMLNMVIKIAENVHRPHSAKVRRNIERSQIIYSTKQQKTIASIAERLERSSNYQKQKKKQLKQKMEVKHMMQNDQKQTVKQSMVQLKKIKSKSLQNCKCNKVIGQIDEQLNPEKNLQSSSVFLTASKELRANNLANRERIQVKKEKQDERQIGMQRQITQALDTKSTMMSSSNCLIRKLRANNPRH